MMRKTSNIRNGFTVVELMVTIVIVAVLAATVGTFFVKLLTIQENEREDAYVREKLADICGNLADALSLGSSISSYETWSNQEVVVKYRQETGGVSLETGNVTRVAYLVASLNATNRILQLDAEGIEVGKRIVRKERIANGDAELLPLTGDLISFTITPLNAVRTVDTDVNFPDYSTSDAALGYLQLQARYRVRDDDGNNVAKTTTVGRVVRLWNHN